MQYKFEKTDQDYSDLASGRVLYSLPGHPAFPVRLASEIFQRCLARRQSIYGVTSRCTLYDPCCGAGYLLSVVAYLHREHIREVIASDIDQKAVELAKRNLALSTVAGLERRISEITTMIEQYDKDSHRDALRSAYLLKDRISAFDDDFPISTKAFRTSAMDGRAMLEQIEAGSVDVVLTDVPYGWHSDWQGDEPANPLSAMLQALSRVLSDSSVVAIVSDKGKKVSHKAFQRVEQFQVGKRRVVLLKTVR